eukprot:6214077-Prymnesium_polylepis.1
MASRSLASRPRPMARWSRSCSPGSLAPTRGSRVAGTLSMRCSTCSTTRIFCVSSGRSCRPRSARLSSASRRSRHCSTSRRILMPTPSLTARLTRAWCAPALSLLTRHSHAIDTCNAPALSMWVSHATACCAVPRRSRRCAPGGASTSRWRQ